MKSFFHRIFAYLANLFGEAKAGVETAEQDIVAKVEAVEAAVANDAKRTIADVQADLSKQQTAHAAAVDAGTAAQAAKKAAEEAISALIAEGRGMAGTVETDFKAIEAKISSAV